MLKNNFIRLLRTLNPKEVSQFEKHLKRYCRNRLTLIKIFTYFKNLYPGLAHPKKMKLENAYKKLMGKPLESKQDRLNFLNCLSDLNLFLKSFLLEKELNNSPFVKEMLWLKVLNERGLYQKHQNQLKKSISNYQHPNYKDLWQNFKLFYLHHFSFFSRNVEKLNTNQENLNKAMRFLDLFYATMKLKYGSEMENRNQVLQVSHQAEMIESILEFAKKPTFKEEINLQFYYLFYNLMKTRENENFLELKSYLVLKQNILGIETLETGLGYLINYAGGKIKEGHFSFNQEIFELYEVGFAKKIFIQQGTLDASHFLNFVDVACAIQKTNRASKFIDQYQIYLPPELMVSTSTLGKGQVSFTEKKFNYVILLFEGIEIPNVFHSLRAKILILKSTYELGEIEAVMDGCDALNRFVKRNKILGMQTSNAAINFSKKLKYLISAKKDRQDLKKEIEESSSLFSREWLLEKLQFYKSI